MAQIDNTPLVSICCSTYNHANYIRKAIDGFLMQNTNFPFEILIHDDASTDGTTNIIKEYEHKFPSTIKPIYQKVNQYSQGISPGQINRNRAKGKYIALCEGDDYWTDSMKLQKQVDFLEDHDDFSISFHNSLIDNGIGQKEKLLLNPGCYTPSEIFLGRIIPTQTILYRNLFDYPSELFRTMNGDTVLFCWITSQTNKGAYFHIDIKDSIYRHHQSGVWSSISLKQKYWNSFKTMKHIYKHFKGFRKEIKTRIYHMNNQFWEIETNSKNKILLTLKIICFGIKNFEIGFIYLIAKSSLKNILLE